jgi:hypothetical protein
MNASQYDIGHRPTSGPEQFGVWLRDQSTREDSVGDFSRMFYGDNPGRLRVRTIPSTDDLMRPVWFTDWGPYDELSDREKMWWKNAVTEYRRFLTGSQAAINRVW